MILLSCLALAVTVSTQLLISGGLTRQAQAALVAAGPLGTGGTWLLLLAGWLAGLCSGAVAGCREACRAGWRAGSEARATATPSTHTQMLHGMPTLMPC